MVIDFFLRRRDDRVRREDFESLTMELVSALRNLIRSGPKLMGLSWAGLLLFIYALMSLLPFYMERSGAKISIILWLV